MYSTGISECNFKISKNSLYRTEIKKKNKFSVSNWFLLENKKVATYLPTNFADLILGRCIFGQMYL